MKARSLKTLPLLGCLLLTACAGGPDTRVDYVKTRERFQGVVPCVDCRGIDTDLVIQRNAVTGSPEGFYLHEVKIDAPGGERVSTSWGNWSRHQDVSDPSRRLYVLQPELGSPRVYAPLESGSLQPLDARGNPMVDDAGKTVTLSPLTPDLSPRGETGKAGRHD
ncbi:copper resistance protein NlpE N-terminal domain-containing protein [Modicisalibacter radicis]|uniref:copper resistance protein NlpE N-terminal domain-containing protein n=1 Tax=Halomonas sp. EAR18 TaxID=2518972 RepID=UPI00109CD101|nr:copper resistance protein NlpE N-terminal domain-containing protein [Halomonas sp. EAR18]